VHRSLSIVIAGALLVLGLGWSPLARPAVDVRLLVDVSASMGRTDPEGLRVEALQLMLDLLPDDAYAGVWTYARYVNLYVPHGPVTPDWRVDAARRTAGLPAVGTATRLLQAVDEASWDRSRDSERERHLLVLTDGGVHLDEGARADSLALAELLERLLPELVAAGIVVHTLALSEQADQSLLRQLSLATGGRHQVLVHPDQARIAMLQVLDRLRPEARLPLADGEAFHVDPAMRELTLLRLRESDDRELVLEDPDGERFDRETPRNRLRWHHGKAYDLITLERPKPGRWVFRAPSAGAGVRLYPVTDLALELSPLPATLLPESLEDLTLTLRAGDEPVADPALLELLTVKATLAGGDAEAPLLVEAATPGRYRIHLLDTAEPGAYELAIRVSAPTFERELRRGFEVRNPVTLDVLPAGEGAVAWLRLTSAEVDYRDLEVTGLLKRPPEPTRRLPFTALPAGLYRLDLPAGLETVELAVALEGRYFNGAALATRLAGLPLTLPLSRPRQLNTDLAGRPLLTRPLAARLVPETPAAPPPAVVAPTPAPVPQAPPLPLWLGLLLGLSNLALGASLWLLLRPAGREGEPGEELARLTAALRAASGAGAESA